MRGINGDGIAGRDRDALGVVIVSECNDSEDCEMSARSKSAGGAVLSRSSEDSVPRFEATSLAEVGIVTAREVTELNWSFRMEISTFASRSSSLSRWVSSSRPAFSKSSCSRRIFSSNAFEYLDSISARLDETARSLRSKSSFPISSSRRCTLVC